MEAQIPVFVAANRGYRYGDGFFETMRVAHAVVPLWALHRKRIEKSIAILKYIHPQTSLSDIYKQVIKLCQINTVEDSATVRLSFFNGNGSVYDDNVPMEYVIEAMPFSENLNQLSETGLNIGICTDIKKSCDVYASLKSANYLFSRVAVAFAKKNTWHEALVLNQHGNICESSVANIFWVKNGTVYTTPLSEGCVQGIMRSYIISKTLVTEKICTQDDLLLADEIFLTNATRGIRWVGIFDNKKYDNKITNSLYHEIVLPLLKNE